MIKFIKSLPFHMKSAGMSLIRHFVMTLSASSAVMVTLILLSAFLLIVGNVSAFADNIEDDIRIHVVLGENITTDEQIKQAESKIKGLNGVEELTFSSKENELRLWIEEKGEIFSAYEGENNPLHNAYFVSVTDANQIETIAQRIRNLDVVDSAVYGGNSISQMVDVLDSVRTGIVVFVALLGVLAIFLISNTIKMAIYSRTSEIAIMRNVGATNTFIKTPFMMEGLMIGLMGAIIPSILTYFAYDYIYTSMGGQLFSNVFALQPIIPFTYEIMTILFLAGMLVGILGSFVSTTRYLHWKR